MHEIRVSVPDGQSARVARAAADAGIPQVTVYRVFVHGLNQDREVVSAESSTPASKAFVDALLAADWFDPARCSITTRELRAILDHQPMSEITRPMVEPSLDVLEDLWMLNHITPSYLGRAGSAALLLAYGMFENSAVSIVVAALFLPFLSQVLGISFGLWAGDRALARTAALALGISGLASIVAGAAVALVYSGPFRYTDFKPPLWSFVFSCAIGIAAGLASADDAGRRYIIGVAAGVQFAVFPVWLGVCLVRGFPDLETTWERIATLAINLATILVISGVVYALAGLKRTEAGHFRKKVSRG
ncbi:MAG: hypothetical protein M3O35_13660 [Acidobacteriota bacterium]|nr:hypothetical protein [Acidobacteriota bacterium]